MNTSFGIEFEFDVIDKYGERVSHDCEFHRNLADNWDYQEDATATVELRSPVFTSLEEAIESIKKQFVLWCTRFDDLAPYPFSVRNRSLGQHIHIGTPNNALSIYQKNRIASATIPLYPFLGSIHAQPIPTSRGLHSLYCYPLVNSYDFQNGQFISTDHYCEISNSHHGTVEFRLFDSNIPQVSLTCSWILTSIAKKVLNYRIRLNNQIDRDTYLRERSSALTYGVSAVDIITKLKYLRDLLGNIEIPNISCIKDLLFLCVRYGLNAYQVYNLVNANPFNYFRIMFMNPDKYLENLLLLENIRNRDKIERWLSTAKNINTIDELIGIAISTLESLKKTIKSTRNKSIGVSRSFVRECIANGNYVICRLSDVPRFNYRDVAERISYLLKHHGEGMVNVKTAEEIIEDRARYYVIYVYDRNRDIVEILGCISVDRHNGEIGHLVVDRRFRGLGIGKILLQFAIDFLRECRRERPYAYVRNLNAISRIMLERSGFTIVRSDDRGYIMALSKGGD